MILTATKLLVSETQHLATWPNVPCPRISLTMYLQQKLTLTINLERECHCTMLNCFTYSDIWSADRCKTFIYITKEINFTLSQACLESLQTCKEHEFL